jgi:hypothetical protein
MAPAATGSGGKCNSRDLDRPAFHDTCEPEPLGAVPACIANDRHSSRYEQEYKLVPINPQTRQARREPARRAIKALYGAKVPDAAELPNKFLVKRVTEWLEKNNYPVPSLNTILRAAGRK